MIDDDGAPCHKRAKNEADRQPVLTNRPFFHPSPMFGNSVFGMETAAARDIRGNAEFQV